MRQTAFMNVLTGFLFVALFSSFNYFLWSIYNIDFDFRNWSSNSRGLYIFLTSGIYYLVILTLKIDK